MKKCFFLLLLCFAALPFTAYAQEPPEYDLFAFPSAYITTANLNLRSQPTTESEKLYTFPRGTIVWVTDFLDYEWFYVYAGDLNGYMKSEFLAEFLVEMTGEEIPLGVPEVEAQDPETLDTPSAPSTYEEPSAPAVDLSSVTYVETSYGSIVELLDWADAKPVFKTGEPAQVIDVRTKASYWVKSFSNGKHADVEPVTANDTAALLGTYGGRWSWETRPVVVIIGGRKLAASINGMPHGGGVNDSNNMNGQICIHFQGSRTHNGNRSHENDHQNCVMEAFNTVSGW